MIIIKTDTLISGMKKETHTWVCIAIIMWYLIKVPEIHNEVKTASSRNDPGKTECPHTEKWYLHFSVYTENQLQMGERP